MKTFYNLMENILIQEFILHKKIYKNHKKSFRWTMLNKYKYGNDNSVLQRRSVQPKKSDEIS